MSKLVAVRKDKQGNITHFLTDTEEIITAEQAETMAKEGEFASITELHQDGTWIIDDATQHLEGHNLGDLPEF